MHRKDPRTAAFFLPDSDEAPKKDGLPIAALAWLRAIIRREFPEEAGPIGASDGPLANPKPEPTRPEAR